MKKIVENKEYGEHVILTCENHHYLRWSTKNISPIGSRTIFYQGDKDDHGHPECSCKLGSLIPLR